ncbi:MULTISPECIES: hypothetical protein [unclassified Streptomyces]|jgi:hypothetical protein|nr:hypothetical protein [Streptomyces sp. JV190]
MARPGLLSRNSVLKGTEYLMLEVEIMVRVLGQDSRLVRSLLADQRDP